MILLIHIRKKYFTTIIKYLTYDEDRVPLLKQMMDFWGVNTDDVDPNFIPLMVRDIGLRNRTSVGMVIFV